MIERPRAVVPRRADDRARPAQPRAAVGTIGGLVDDGVTVLLTTQYLEEADRLADADRRARPRTGRRARDAPAELKARLGGGVRAAAVRRAPSVRGRTRGAAAAGRRRGTAHDRVADGRQRPRAARAARRLEDAGAPAVACRRRPEPRRRLPVPHRATDDRRRSPDDYDLRARARRHGRARCLRRSLRDPEAFFTALTLPGHPDAAVRLRVRRRDRTRRPLRRLRRARA